MHPRNRHQGRYDFERLIQASPELAVFVAKNKYDDLSVDFSDPLAVKALNRAILKSFYGLFYWDIPAGYLCPPIPGRSDYLHSVADLLASSNNDIIPRGPGVRILDIGVGSSCIYPLIGHHEYDWQFIGSDIDAQALASAKKIVESNESLLDAVELRLQPSALHTLQGVMRSGEVFDATLCNPPFHRSIEEATHGTRRKWKNLDKGDARSPHLNFGGQGSELWCEGGETEFIERMIHESVPFAQSCFWFTTLVSRVSRLDEILTSVTDAGVVDQRIMDMSQGQKKSRLVAWTFLTREQQDEWRMRRWGQS
jgi:23S rRNA (adenine1618-N6)-methyltransferase